MTSMKKSTVWYVERTDWFGESEYVNGQSFDTKREAQAFAATLRRESAACDDPADKVRFEVVSEVWERPA
jgi:hypothetical protein